MFPEEKLAEMEQNCSVYSGPHIYPWMQDMILYEVYVRNFSPEGNFKGIVKKLPYLKNLGVNTLWLMPIHPIGKKGRKGTLGCPYSIKDYKEINPEYGTKDDFKKFVEEAHKASFKIIIDLVINHSSNDNINMKNHPDWFYRDSKGEFTRRHSDWTDITDNNFEDKNFCQYIINVTKYWVEEFDIDGYRCDVAGMVPLKFWGNLVTKLRKIKEDIYMLAEWYNRPPLCIEAFQGDYQGLAYNRLKEFSTRKIYPFKIIKTYETIRKIYPKKYLPLNFIENHDRIPSVNLLGKEGIKPWIGYILTIPGTPLIYNGQEIGNNQYLSLFEKEPIRWDNENKNILNYYKSLIEFRNNYPITKEGKLIGLKTLTPSFSAAYAMKNEKENIICIMNTSSENKEVKIEIPNEIRLPSKIIFPSEFKPKSLIINKDNISLKMLPNFFIVLA